MVLVFRLLTSIGMAKEASGRDLRTAWELVVASSDLSLRRRLAFGLRHTYGIASVHQAKERPELERRLLEHRISIVLLALPLRGFVELEALRTILELAPESRTIVMAEAPAEAAAVDVLKLGARGYCALTTELAVIGKAIELVQQGEIWVARNVMSQLVDELTEQHTARSAKRDAELQLLTPREQQISELIAVGVSNKEVADKLSIAERTVKAHLTHIFRKLGVSSRLQLALHALRPSPAATTEVR